jgi:hypothetical protein
MSDFFSPRKKIQNEVSRENLLENVEDHFCAIYLSKRLLAFLLGANTIYVHLQLPAGPLC